MTPRVRPEAAAVEEAAKMLIEAKHPVVICGDEVWKSEAVPELMAFSEKLALPVSLDRSSYRNFPSHHPNNVGAFSLSSPWVKNGADVIVFIGSRDVGGKVVPSTPEFPTSAKVILLWLSERSLALDLPKVIALPPVPWSWRMKKMKNRNRKTIGIHCSRMLTQMLFSWGLSIVTSTLASVSFCTSAVSGLGPVVRNFSLESASVPS